MSINTNTFAEAEWREKIKIAPYETAVDTLNNLGYEVMAEDGFYEVWKGESFVTKFLEDKAEIVKMAERAQAEENARRAEEKGEEQAFADATEGFTEAAILDRGKVIGSCYAAPSAKEITLGLVQDGQIINARTLKLSRSTRNLDAAKTESEASAALVNREIVYSW